MDQWMERLAEFPAWLQALILAVSTLGSEDLTTITAGILVAENTIHPMTAILGCFIGIFVGDGLLYVVGLVVGRPAIKLPILRNMLSEEKVDQCAEWFEKNGIMVIIVSRFLPGTRLPTYFAAGLVGARVGSFLLASGVAVAVWTPLLVLLSWAFGEQLLAALSVQEEYKWPVMGLGILLMFVVVRILLKLGSESVRIRIRSRFYRLHRWEFWPIAVVYFPIFIYNLWLALKYRRTFLPLISNPGIDFSGYVGESKNDIMTSIQGQEEFVAQYLDLRYEGTAGDRRQQIRAWMNRLDLSYPIMLKPDVGQRGDGVQKIEDDEHLDNYLDSCRVDIQAQEYLPGPYEFGVFYMRFPEEEQGRVLSLTGKEFPQAVGDGRSTLEELILRNPQTLGRIHIFRERFKDRLAEVPEEAEVIPLVNAGNHCLGTIFTDSSYLITKELHERFDDISKSIPGFYIGRYDVRASNLENFRNGKDFKIMELNGAAGEPSNMYDARHGYFQGLEMLRDQYRDLWKIGAQNLAKGEQPVSLLALIKEYFGYRRKQKERPPGA